METKSAALGYRDDGGGQQMVRIVYNDGIARQFAFASVVWGLVGMLVGVVIALQMAFWQANVHSMLSFGRLRPLHTNAVIFAFVGNMIFAGVYYSSQRLLKTRIASDALARVHFWGWQLIIVAAAVTLPLGMTQGKEYAELEWPIDIAIALVWVIFAVNFFWTIAKRNEKHLYVAIWFYIATIVTVAMLHIVNSLAMPLSLTQSYSIYGGAQDALVQWWYGHNAVAFFLTTPVLGIMYYFLPKAAGRPVYSYRLSVIHFWALVFVYIWAGPHHLLNTSLPDWAQSLGMVFSLMLWAPSWGGMLNGLLTLRGAWDKVRTDPVLKFFVAGVTFYGMATLEGPLLSIKALNGLTHYTDWIVGHVHEGALGWNGFMAAGMFYWMIPRLFGTKLYSQKMADQHFWLGTFGIILYVVAMWVSGLTQGAMWRATNEHGALAYPNFIETLIAIRAMYWTRLAGGTLYLTGMFMMGYNLYKTARAGKAVDAETEVLVEVKPPAAHGEPEPSALALIFGKPVVLTTLTLVIFAAMAVVSEAASVMLAALGVGLGVGSVLAFQLVRQSGRPTWHRLIEGRALGFTVVTVLAVVAGGVAELIPAIVTRPPLDPTATRAEPYTPLELEGRDVYLREGCYNCHSQMIRPFRTESLRYGEPSRLEESRFDHPFQWGSKRTGPDLAREGSRQARPNLWHYRHMIDPREISPGSNMPPYPHLAREQVDFGYTANKMRAMRSVGVPYTAAQIEGAARDARRQADEIVADLRTAGANVAPDTRMVALIAYLQRLGRPAWRPADAAPAASAAQAPAPAAGAPAAPAAPAAH